MKTENARLFWVVRSPDDNNEIFATSFEAKQYAEKYGSKAPYTISIMEVKHFFQEADGAWNYEDFADTFNNIITVTMQNDTRDTIT